MEKSFDPRPDTGGIDAPVITQAFEPAPRPAKREHTAPLRIALEVDLLPAVFQPGYAAKQVELTLNTTVQRVTLKLLLQTLTKRGDTLLDGSPIKHPQQALAWLLEQLAIRLPCPLMDELLEGAG